MNQHVIVGPGDDAAVVAFDGKQEWLIATDMLIADVHFTIKDTAPEAIGRKLLAVNLSDIAAMAGVPLLASVALAIPNTMSEDFIYRVTTGIEELASKYGVAIVGGDTNSTSGPLTLSLTLIGKTSAKGPLLRSTAQKDDSILVTGTLGGSRFGKHLSFIPRVEEALYLHEHFPIHAMIDVSDGLASDLRRLTEDKGLGAELFKGQIPISAAIHNSPHKLRHALCDGEDFELLFTMPSLEAMKLIKAQPLANCNITRIGTVIEKAGLFWLNDDRSHEIIAIHGYEHGVSSPNPA
jgi:thiamine-monophosphate kinase